MHKTYRDRGFTLLSLWGENEYGITPERDELLAFAEHYDLDLPVLADQGFDTFYTFQPRGGGLPTQVLLEPGARVHTIDNFIEEGVIESVLPY